MQACASMLSSCHAAQGVHFSAGLCLLVATNVISVHSQNSKCEGSRISVAKNPWKGTLQGKHVQLVIIAPRIFHFSAFIISLAQCSTLLQQVNN